MGDDVRRGRLRLSSFRPQPAGLQRRIDVLGASLGILRHGLEITPPFAAIRARTLREVEEPTMGGGAFAVGIPRVNHGTILSVHSQASQDITASGRGPRRRSRIGSAFFSRTTRAPHNLESCRSTGLGPRAPPTGALKVRPGVLRRGPGPCSGRCGLPASASPKLNSPLCTTCCMACRFSRMAREIGDRTTPFQPRINFTRSHRARIATRRRCGQGEATKV